MKRFISVRRPHTSDSELEAHVHLLRCYNPFWLQAEKELPVNGNRQSIVEPIDNFQHNTDNFDSESTLFQQF